MHYTGQREKLNDQGKRDKVKKWKREKGAEEIRTAMRSEEKEKEDDLGGEESKYTVSVT